MEVTITCDSENTMRFIYYILRTGSCNSREKELQGWGIDTSDTQLDVTYSIAVNPTVEMKINVEKPSQKKKNNDKTYLYAARDIGSGKLVSNITNPRRKYWDKRGNAVNAITYHNNKDACYRKNNEPGQVELVVFELVEVKDENN